MQVRELNRDEILPALHMIWEVFVADVAPSYTREGVAQFQESIRYDYILGLWERKEIVMFGAFEDGNLAGTISVRKSGHIFMFYVKKSCQGKGAGRMLFEAARRHCARRLGLNYMTVHAAPGAAAKYQHMGMRPAGPEQFQSGMRYVPMEMYINPVHAGNPDSGQGGMKNRQNNNIPVLIVGIVIAVLLFLLLLLGAVALVNSTIFRTIDTVRQNEQRHYEDWQDGYFYDDFYSEDSSGSEENPVGLDLIPPKIESGLSYEIGEDSYIFTDEEKQTTYIDFLVRYPVLSGLSGTNEQEINEILKKCAMESVEEIYENPSQEVKDNVLGAAYPVLASYVEYKVCYASQDFISVAFEDYSYRGNTEEYVQKFRTVNINLKDGTVYELGDIVDISDEFTQFWIERMRSDAGYEEVFSELTEEELKATLSGDSMDEVYQVRFFVDGEGLNVGYELHYEENDPNDMGHTWLVAVLQPSEVEPYAKESTFWDFIS